MITTDNLLVWRLLLALGQTGSLTKAAIATDLELSTASRLLSGLEKELGITLVDRQVKPMCLAKNMTTMLPYVQELVDAHRHTIEFIDNLATVEPHTTIRVSVPSNISRSVLVHFVDQYQSVAPTVDLELYSNMDHSDVLNGNVDVAYLPYFPVNVVGLHVMPILRGTNFMLATPRYLEEHGVPNKVEDLVHHLLFVRTGRHYPTTTRLFSLTEMFDFETLLRQPLPDKLGLLAQKEFSYTRHLRKKSKLSILYGDTLSCLQSALEGVGIAVDLSLGLVGQYLQSGQLVPVLKDWHRPIWNNTLVTRERNVFNEPIMQFMHWYAEREKLSGDERWKSWYRHFGMDPEAVLERGY